MEYGLFTTDNTLLECLLFFMTFSVMYKIVASVYEDVIIRNDNHSVGFVALAWFSTTSFLGELVGVIWYLPKMIKYWNASDEGRKHRTEFLHRVVVAIVVILVMAALVFVFFLANYLLVDAGAGHFCKKW